MKRKQSGSSARGARAGMSAKPMGNSRIDFSDIPESTDDELKRRPARRQAAYRQCETAHRHPH